LCALSKSRQQKISPKKSSLRFSGFFEKKLFGIGDAWSELPL
jgi:hypothetical protein